MATITFKEQTFECTDGQSVLERLLSAGQSIPHACKNGACQTCLMKSFSEDVPDKSQRGLKPSLKAQNYFLACQCIPNTDLDIGLANDGLKRASAKVVHHERISDEILLLQLQRPEGYEYIPGQYLTLWKDELNGRSYSIASVPDLTPDILELHIHRFERGIVSTWLCDEITLGDELQIQDAIGHCCYTPLEQTGSIMLAGAGTGLAPLLGIAQDALTQGHSGEIHLFHSAKQMSGLYKDEALKDLSLRYDNFYYHPVLADDADTSDTGNIKVGDLSELVLRFIQNPEAWRYYLCGAEKRVNQLRRKLFLSGAVMKNIHADAFIQRST